MAVARIDGSARPSSSSAVAPSTGANDFTMVCDIADSPGANVFSSALRPLPLLDEGAAVVTALTAPAGCGRPCDGTATEAMVRCTAAATLPMGCEISLNGMMSCLNLARKFLSSWDRRVSFADRWELGAFLEPQLPHQRPDTNPRDSGLQRFVRRPESDPRALWRPSLSANAAQASLATETAHPTRVETIRCLGDRVGPERATRLKPESEAPHTYSEIAATGASP